MKSKTVSRREFLKASSVGCAGLSFLRIDKYLDISSSLLPEFPQADRLGRVLEVTVPLKLRPDIDSQDVGQLFEDDIVPWLREVVGSRPMWNTQRFVETLNGYVYAPNLQPVLNIPNSPLQALPNSQGFWVEMSVPYIDLILANPPARSPWLKRSAYPRLYYGQIMWVDEIRNDDQGVTWYRVKENFGSYGDIFWVPGEALRPIPPEEWSPINPDIEDKHVEVNVTHQYLSCFEGTSEVYYCRVSTGGKYDVNGAPSSEWATPLGTHTIWRKLVSTHMTGGTTGGGYDLPGIGWTTLFSGQGMAIHSTFWHNSYGVPRSHGCVNAKPDDAKWVFRWTLPVVPPETGEITISGKGSTRVTVKE